MSEISYFQRYSQRENHTTNNTLLLFRHLYDKNPRFFQSFVNRLSDDEQAHLEIGIRFTQQIKETASVPDALINQAPIRIYVEAKRNGSLDEGQLRNHLEAAKSPPKPGTAILALTKEPIAHNLFQNFARECYEHDIAFLNTTYTTIIDTLTDMLPAHESDLVDIVEDYADFIRNEELYLNPFKMVAFPCGTSIELNTRYQIYYHPVDRKSAGNIPYMGFYNKMQISHFGKIASSVVVDFSKDPPEPIAEFGPMPKDAMSQIQQIASEANSIGHNLFRVPHRYYFLEEIYEVNMPNGTRHGIQSRQYFDLRNYSDKLDISMSTEEISKEIRDTPFN